MTPFPHLSATWFLRSRLKFRHLQIMLAVSRHQKLNQAADELGMSQPAASKLLADLETGLGQPLFQRIPRGLLPTAQGEVLTRRAAAILSELDAARAELNALADGKGGRLAVGSIDAPAVALLVDAVAALQTQDSNLEIHLVSGSSDLLMQRLLDGALDVMLGRPVGDADLGAFAYREIGTEALRFICRVGHPLLELGPLSLGQLTGERWILQPPGTALRRAVDRMFYSTGLPGPAHVVNTSALLITTSFVARTDAISVVSEPVALQHVDATRIALLPVASDVGIGGYGLITPKLRPMSPVTAAFVRALEGFLAG